jgi:hypothetical protein
LHRIAPQELAKLDDTLKVCEERRALFQSLQPDFCHPPALPLPADPLS